MINFGTKINRITILTLFFYLLSISLPGILPYSSAIATEDKKENKTDVVQEDTINKMPKAKIPFISNEGQHKNKKIKYYSSIFTGMFSVTDQGVFCKNFLQKVASNFSIVLHHHFP